MKQYLLYAFFYRLIMRFAHRYDWHLMRPCHSRGDMMVWCHWCGLRIAVNHVAENVLSHPDCQYPLLADSGTPHRCPICDGTGLVSRPPTIARDLPVWTDRNATVYSCHACLGTGVLWCQERTGKYEFPKTTSGGYVVAGNDTSAG